MTRPRTLVLILAGGKGSRLELLTQHRAKPAVPFGGTHRLIDFSLSNCAYAGIDDVWVTQQFNSVSISEHLSNGRPWDLDRTNGGLLTLHPRQANDQRSGFHQGTAHSLWHHAPLIRDFNPDALVVVSADAIYRLDYSQVVADHHASGASVTMVTVEVDPDDASRYGVVTAAADGRITDYAYKPEKPQGNLVTNEVFVFTPDALLELLDELADDDGDNLEDLGHHILPRLVQQGSAREWRFDGYWRDVGTVEAYWKSHMELAADDAPFTLADDRWPIRTRSDLSAPARIGDEANVLDSLIASGATITGEVRSSVVGRRAVVEKGAIVRESVLLPGVVVGPGAIVERAIIDENTRLEAGARVGGPNPDRDDTCGGITVVGANETIAGDTRLPAGARYPELPCQE